MSIKEWVLTTKLGHFTFTSFCGVILILLFHHYFPFVSLSAMFVGIFFITTLRSITDHNKRWY